MLSRVHVRFKKAIRKDEQLREGEGCQLINLSMQLQILNKILFSWVLNNFRAWEG